jgi:AcrR family transcriptional regulator
VDDKRRLILDQALALVDERGLAAMSMRAVAERVGLTSMALYPYVGGKDAMLDGLVDLLHLELGAAYSPSMAGPEAAGHDVARSDVARSDVARSDVARSDVARSDVARSDVTRSDVARSDVAGRHVHGSDVAGDDLAAPDPATRDVADIAWAERLRALGRAVRGLAQAHPGAFPLLLNRPAASASAAWLTAALVAVLHDAGVPAAEAPRLARMVCAFLLGYVTGEVTGGLPAHDGEFDANLADLVRLVEVAVRVG